MLVRIVIVLLLFIEDGVSFTSAPMKIRNFPIHAAALPKANEEGEILGPLAADATAASKQEEETQLAAQTGTVNERLMQELQEAKQKEKFGARSKFSKNFDGFRSQKTDEEREAAIAAARNLNGVNPVVTTIGGVLALAAAFGLWTLTTTAAEFFASHPVVSDFYVVERLAAVFRNLVMGIISLATGFFGVTGLGIFLLGVRVAYGVATGELDPTPLPEQQKQKTELPNVWDLMLNKKPTRRNKKKGDDMFGL
jgi:hypothetical protein